MRELKHGPRPSARRSDSGATPGAAAAAAAGAAAKFSGSAGSGAMSGDAGGAKAGASRLDPWLFWGLSSGPPPKKKGFASLLIMHQHKRGLHLENPPFFFDLYLRFSWPWRLSEG